MNRLLFVRTPLSRILVLSLLAAVAPACGGGGGNPPPPPPPPFYISTSSLPNGVVGSAYNPTNQPLSTASGTAPVTFVVFSGSLPAGLSLAGATGVISGTPAAPVGMSSFTIRATDANGLIADRVLWITVTGVGPGPLTVTAPATLPAGTQGSPYTTGLSASGGAPPYTWSISAGTLPAGLTLNGSIGQIAGIPTTAGTPPSFTVQVTDSLSVTATKIMFSRPCCSRSRRATS